MPIGMPSAETRSFLCNGFCSTAHHLASARGYIQISRVLLEHGADGNVQDTNGNASIHLAAEEDHVGVVRLLIEQGEADPNIQDVDGHTLVHLAAWRNHVDISVMAHA